MSDCIEFSCSPSVCVESSCFTGECWTPSCCTPVSDVSPMRVSSSLDMNTSSLYSSSAAVEAPRAAALDSNKSTSDLVKEGAMVQSNLAPRLDQTERNPADQPKVIVSKDGSVTPDYIVRKDGQVEVVGNPDAGDKAHSVYRVQVEEGADPKNTDALVKYLNDRIHAKEPSADVSLSAEAGLVSEETSRLFKNRPADENKPEDKPNDNPDNPDDNPPPDDDSPSNPGGGDCPGPGPSPDDSPSPEDNPQDNPPDSQPDAPPAAPLAPLDSLLDAARLNNWDNNTLGSLGAYEINAAGWFSSWLDDDMMAELGNPPDFKKLGKVLAKHKNDPKFKNAMSARLNNMREQGDSKGADKIESLFNKLGDEKDGAFAENFGVFLNSQKPGGRNATGEEMTNFFDKDLQKAIASSRMSDIAHDAGVKIKDLAPEQAAKMSLAGALGHVPSEKEMADYTKYLQLVSSKYKPGKPAV